MLKLNSPVKITAYFKANVSILGLHLSQQIRFLSLSTLLAILLGEQSVFLLFSASS